MDPSRQTRIAEWLRASRGKEIQEHLAEDITRVTGWPIDRTRYSRYESGKLPVGKATLKHFIDYWATRDVPGPDFSSTAETAEPPDLASALSALAAELTAIRLEREAWSRGVAAVLLAYEDGRVPRELLDALAPQLPEGAQPVRLDR